MLREAYSVGAEGTDMALSLDVLMACVRVRISKVDSPIPHILA